MGAMTNLLVRSDVDGTSDLTFLPVRDTPFPHWRTNASGLPITGQKRVETQFETLKNGKVKVNIKVVNPIMELIPAGTVNSSGVQAAPMVADEDSFSGTFFLSPRGSTDTRAELMRMVAHLLVGAGVTTSTILNPVTAGAHAWRDVAAAGYPVPYSIINLLFPGA